MRDAGRLWRVPRPGRQRKSPSVSSKLLISDPFQVLFAYHIEALVPSNPNMAQPLQKMNTIVHKDVQFFRTGRLNGRTLLVFVKKDGVRRLLQCEEHISCARH